MAKANSSQKMEYLKVFLNKDKEKEKENYNMINNIFKQVGKMIK